MTLSLPTSLSHLLNHQSPNPTDSYYKMADRTLLSSLSSLLIILPLCLKVFSGCPYAHYKVQLILTVTHNKGCLWHSPYFPFRPHSSTLILHNAIIIAIPWVYLASLFHDFPHAVPSVWSSLSVNLFILSVSF